MRDLFDLLSGSCDTYGRKIKTNLGDKTPLEIVDHLTYISYATQRDHGMSHESCIRIGLGNESMKKLYEQEQPNSDL